MRSKIYNEYTTCVAQVIRFNIKTISSRTFVQTIVLVKFTYAWQKYSSMKNTM